MECCRFAYRIVGSFSSHSRVRSCGSGSEEIARLLEFSQRLGTSDWEDCGSGKDEQPPLAI